MLILNEIWPKNDFQSDFKIMFSDDVIFGHMGKISDLKNICSFSNVDIEIWAKNDFSKRLQKIVF